MIWKASEIDNTNLGMPIECTANNLIMPFLPWQFVKILPVKCFNIAHQSQCYTIKILCCRVLDQPKFMVFHKMMWLNFLVHVNRAFNSWFEDTENSELWTHLSSRWLDKRGPIVGFVTTFVSTTFSS